jgi:hypothetical protein
MNYSKNIEDYLEYFIDHYEFFKSKKTKNKREQVYSVYEKIYKELVKSEKELNLSKQQLTHDLNYITFPREQTPLSTLLESNFVDISIKKFIKEEGIFYLTYKFKLHNKSVCLYFVFYDDKDLDDLDQYSSIVFYMLMMLNICSKMSSITCSKTLNVYIYLTPFLKDLPENYLYSLEKKNCNSGVTTTCSVYNEICIFRKEEFFKVFLHEVFHTYGLDFSILPIAVYQDKIKKLFPLPITFNLYEAYTEFWATIFNNAFLSFSTLKKSAIKKDKQTEFNHYMELTNNLERMFSLYQINKLLLFFNMEYNNFYDNNELSKYIRSHVYKEKTNAFMYYIIKGILMYHYPEFLIWCDNRNITYYKFDKYQGNVKFFIDFISKIYKNDEMLLDISKMSILALDKKPSKLQHLDTTLRMSLLEIKI